MDAEAIERFIEASALQHRHVCPRQVLGVRIGLAGAAGLGLEAPRKDKRLLVIVESDGCFVDGVSATTGCTVGHRTLRVEDYGKVAATFVDVSSERALRVAPRGDVPPARLGIRPQRDAALRRPAAGLSQDAG